MRIVNQVVQAGTCIHISPYVYVYMQQYRYTYVCNMYCYKCMCIYTYIHTYTCMYMAYSGTLRGFQCLCFVLRTPAEPSARLTCARGLGLRVEEGRSPRLWELWVLGGFWNQDSGEPHAFGSLGFFWILQDGRDPKVLGSPSSGIPEFWHMEAPQVQIFFRRF